MIAVLVQHLALIIAALFAGAAIYVSAVEHPARLGLDDRALLAQWKPSYARGTAMQASLALTGTVLASIAAYLSWDWRWLIGAALIFANWPYTFLAIMPVNHVLEATAPEAADAGTRALLVKWGTLHAGRSALGVAAVLADLWAIL